MDLFAVPPQFLISTRLSMACRKLKDKHKKERSKGREGDEGRRGFRKSQRSPTILPKDKKYMSVSLQK